MKNKQTGSIVFHRSFVAPHPSVTHTLDVQSSISTADLVLRINNGEEAPGGRFNSGF